MPDKQEYIIGIDSDGNRTIGNSEFPQFQTYILVYLTQEEWARIMDIPWGDMKQIQSVLSQYY